MHVTTPRGELAVATVFEAVDAVADPDLARALLDDTAWNQVAMPDGSIATLAVPVVYHDPAAEVFALVLPETQRHRELDERIRLLERMRADDQPIPPYARDHAVVFGAAGLRAYLEQQAEDALIQGRIADQLKELERRRAELDRKDTELGRKEAELERSRGELDRVKQDVERRWGEADARDAELGRREAELGRRDAPGAPAKVGGAAAARAGGNGVRGHARLGSDGPEDLTNPFRLETLARTEAATEAATVVAPPPQGVWDDAGTAESRAVAPIHDDPDGEETGRDRVPAPVATPDVPLPPESDPLTTTCAELDAAAAVGDPWLAGFTGGAAPWAIALGEPVRLAVRLGDAAARAIGQGPVDVRLLLHRTPHYPAIVLVVGPPGAIRAGDPTACAVVTLDIGAELDRAALAQLGRGFALQVDLVGARRQRRVRLTAPLAENVGFVVRAAEDHLRTLLAEGGAEPQLARARQLIAAPGFDLFGERHPEAAEFRDDKLGGLDSANGVRRALSIARRFTKPAREDYLVATRGYPLPRWRELRREVLARAVAWGLWMGPELAQVAVSEGFARSRRDLVVKLMPAFEALRGEVAYDLDGDAAEDNHQQLVEEARGLGVALGAASRTVDSQAAAQASGTIDRGAPAPSEAPRTQRTVGELVAALDQRAERVAAAIELCERADPRSIPDVMAAVKKMSRSEAVRVLGMAVRFGAAAAPALVEGLASSKAYLRHGCALALAMLRTDAGTEAVIELLLAEPTEIWREVARAVGQVGPPALMPLASHFGRLGERATASAKERVAWAMAHVGVRGGKAAVEALAGGASVVAPVARAALELLGSAANDEVRVRAPGTGTGPGKEVTVNRAFSRRFFEALEKGLPDVGGAELSAMDASEPLELLDDDLVEEAEDDGSVDLDESDIIAS